MQYDANFIIRLRGWIRLSAIICLLSFNFLMVAAAWTGLAVIWNLTHIVGLVAIICSLICHFTQDLANQSKKVPRKITYKF